MLRLKEAGRQIGQRQDSTPHLNREGAATQQMMCRFFSSRAKGCRCRCEASLALLAYQPLGTDLEQQAKRKYGIAQGRHYPRCKK